VQNEACLSVLLILHWCVCAGILWNLSSKDNLKEKLARETLPELTDKILIPLSGGGDNEGIQHSPSEADIFYNTTGCLRSISLICLLSLCLLLLLKYISLSAFWSHLYFGNLFWQDTFFVTVVCKSLRHSSLQLLRLCFVYWSIHMDDMYRAAQCEEQKPMPKPNCSAFSICVFK